MISIIIPVYNCEKYLCRCVDSVLCQTYQDIECIVVDDGSNDRTPQICDELAKKDNRIKVIHMKNGGVQAAREKALAYCKGDYVMFIDADDYIANTILEVTLKELKKQNADIVCFNYMTNEKRGFEISDKEIVDNRTALKYMLLLTKLDGNLWCKLYKAEIVKNVKFEQKLHCNFVTFSMILRKARKIVIIPITGYYYSVIEGSITHYKNCNPRIVEFEDTARAFYMMVKREMPELRVEAEYFWLRSLLWVNIKTEKDCFVKRKTDWVRKEKHILRKKAGRFFANPYFGFKDRAQLLLCCFNVYRNVYRILK